jgi:hypothetical protein
MDEESPEDDEIEELMAEFEAEEEAYDAGVPRPRYRATHRDGRLMIISHCDALAPEGPVLTMLENSDRSDLLIADLAESVDGGRSRTWELTVTVLTPGEPSEEAEESILTWAGNVGFRRAWLPDRVIPLEGRPSFRSKASVRCENCGHTWRNRGRGFWSQVRKYRGFPPGCLLCGADLPVWEVEAPAVAGR